MTITDYLTQMREARSCQHCRDSVTFRKLDEWFSGGKWRNNPALTMAMLGTCEMLDATGATLGLCARDHNDEARRFAYIFSVLLSHGYAEPGDVCDLFPEPREGGAQ